MAKVQIGANCETRHQHGAEVAVLTAGADGWAETDDQIAALFEAGGWPVERDKAEQEPVVTETQPEVPVEPADDKAAKHAERAAKAAATRAANKAKAAG